MHAARLAALLVSCWTAAALAQWQSKDGKPIADSASRKSLNGFGVSLLVTPDEDWKEKWERPETPHFTEATRVKVGGKLTILIFIVNAKRDAASRVDVRCDILLKRPDGSISFDQKDLGCLRGELRGDPYTIRLAAPVIGFVGEPADPKGEWTAEVSLTDVLRDTTIPLKASFTLE